MIRKLNLMELLMVIILHFCKKKELVEMQSLINVKKEHKEDQLTRVMIIEYLG